MAQARGARQENTSRIWGMTTARSARRLGRSHVLLGLAVGATAMAFLRRRSRPLDLRGQVALVTGGSRGLGLALARELARRGCRLAICARDRDTLSRAESDLRRLDPEALALVADVRDSDAMRRTVAAVEARFGRLDILINNAGTITVGPLDTMTPDDFEDALATHVRGPLHAILAALPGMRERRSGRIVNIASLGGKVSMPHLLPYCTSKFALVGLSEGLRAELGRQGIRVTTVCPSLMRTGSARHALFKGRHRAEYTWFSVSDATPGLSMNADAAAREIVKALRHGVAEIALSTPARAAIVAQALAPGMTARMLSLINALLPAAAGRVAQEAVRGRDSHSWLSPSALTVLDERAAAAYNQVMADLPSGNSRP